MIFKPELALKIVDGEKTVTRRRPSDNPRSPWYDRLRSGALRRECGYKVDQDFTVNPGRGVHRVVEACVVRVGFGPVVMGFGSADSNWEAEGFATEEEFWEAWAGINGTRDRVELVWHIQFEPDQATRHEDRIAELRERVALLGGSA